MVPALVLSKKKFATQGAPDSQVLRAFFIGHASYEVRNFVRGEKALPLVYNGAMIGTPTKDKIISKGLEETADFALSLVKNLKPRDSGATIFGLSGDLGSGKTTFTKEVASLLGIKKEEVTSPTFVIEKIYAINHPGFSHLIHIDAYRLEKADELLHLGWQEIIADPKNLIFVEWPERVKSVLPKQTQTVFFEFVDENTRTIQLQ